MIHRTTLQTTSSHFVWFVFFVVSLFLVSSRAWAQEPHKMIVPFSPIGGSTVPFWIATDERIFQKYGLEITPLFVGGSSTIIQSMAAKQFDIGLVGGAWITPRPAVPMPKSFSITV